MLRRLWLIFAQAVTATLAAIFVVSLVKPEWVPWRPPGTVVEIRETPASQAAAPVPAAPGRAISFSEAARKAVVSVVNISATKQVRRRSPLLDDPVLRRFFGERFNIPETQLSLGSGVIVSREGFVLTNSHVVEGVTEIQVTLNDGRTVAGRIVGADPETDLAVVRIQAPGLTPITFGQSDQLKVGDVVLAIGDPFSVGQTVTMGIVSATGRTMGIIRTGENSGTPQAGYEDFIQTDAAINRGNSGGALITVDGRLMGINSAIISQSGGNEGIGFAIPMNIARFVMDQLISNGKVQRAMIGALLTEVDSTMAKALGMDRPYGAMVNEVVQGKPAAAAGMKAGDVITKINGTEMRDSMQTRNMISMMKPGTKVDITVNRNGKAVTLPVTLTGLDQQFSSESVESSSQSGLDGVSVSEIPEDMRSQLRLDADVKGVVVTRVSPSSKAAAGGIRPRDVIVAIDRQPVTSVGDFERLMKGAQKDAIFVQVKRYVQGRGWSNFFFGVER